MIKSHKNRILSEETVHSQPECNWRQKDTCLLEKNCLDRELIMQFEKEYHQWRRQLKCLTENTFKDQFYKHRNSFKYESKANSTEFSKHFWEMKRKGIENPNQALVSYWWYQTIYKLVKQVRILLTWEVYYFHITGQSH